jgi:outer membrane lipoprotein-sorting protein
MTTEMTALSAEMKLLPAEMQKDLMKKATVTAEVMMITTLDGYRARTEMEGPDRSKTVEITIWDGDQGKKIELQPAEKRATVRNLTNMRKDKIPNPDSRDLLAYFRSLLLDAWDKPDVKRESLGEKDVDGRRVVGFRLSGRGLDKWPPDTVMSLWGDLKTGLPVRIETTMAMAPNVKVTMSDFAFNVDLDESLFSVEPPAGYQVIRGPTIDVSRAEEKDLIDTFRHYSELSGGPFPAKLDMGSLLQSLDRKVPPERGQKRSAKQERETAEAHRAKLQRGLWFTMALPKEADAHYAGRGVSLGAADTPIFWYRPKDAKAYRVIYADLSIRDADTPPTVPVAETEPEEKDLIETFRYYSELSGGPFPSLLDMVSVCQIAAMMSFPFDSPEQPRKPSAKQEQEIAEAQAKLLRGLKFVVSLPPEADAHYAGKGVSLGAADTPIFWYRPKDSKSYRVIHADLSVREADASPNVPDALPERDLIDTFRHYTELSGGPFPDLLEMQPLTQMVLIKNLSFTSFEQLHEPNAKQMQEIMRTQMKFQPGLDFANSLPPDADAHYAGKGVSFGASDTPIFWYRPKDGKNYRVIYADLSVREADAPPSVPDALPEQDLIDTFRHYIQLSGGPFPDSLNARAGLKRLLEKKFGLEKGQKPSAKQFPEYLETVLKFQPGSTFLDSLPPEADAHYAGKGVSLGAADAPIFWHRPKDATKYRVIYADLSVRDADTPPNVPDAQPVPAPSSPKK